ncbi:MAG: D-alanyl-D-alanine carboxypeptidase [Gammaproteobacteria bacterium]|nr:D-alanyl-D-alanine carboxypeptidase [Gammaproteobacteria bacterium]
MAYSQLSSTQTRQSIVSAFIIFTMTLLVISFAHAAPPPPPVPNIDFLADRVFVGDSIRGLHSGDTGTLFDYQADSASHMASTTKSFTLLLAVEAVNNGVVSLDDVISISKKAATINSNHTNGANTHSNVALIEDDQIRFEDLLYAMMLNSCGQSSIAIAQHVAVSTFPSIANDSDAQQEQEFTNMMNNRAIELGLNDTEFFNAYGGNHTHSYNNTSGDVISHRATPRDMAIWFDHGMQYVLYRDIIGYTGDYTFNSFNFGNAYTVSQSSSYPGFRGQKGGSGGGCQTCRIYDARRVNRDILLANTQKSFGDGTLLDYGFASLFHPQKISESSEWTGGWKQNDLTVVSSTLAASAVVQGNGKLRILLWGLDGENGSITHLNAVSIPTDEPSVFGLPAIGSGSRSRTTTDLISINPSASQKKISPLNGNNDRNIVALSPTTPGSITIYDPIEAPPTMPGNITTYDPKPPPSGNRNNIFDVNNDRIIEKVRIVYSGLGNLAVVADTSAGVYLYLYGISINNTTWLRSVVFVGDGNEGRIHASGARLLVTAHRQPNDDLMLKSWKIDTDTGLLSVALDSLSGPLVNELELAGEAGFGGSVFNFMVASSGVAGKPTLRNYRVHSSTGAISDHGVEVSSMGSSLALGYLSGVYVLAFRDTTGRLVVESYEIAANLQIAKQGSSIDSLAENTLDASAKIKIAPFDKDGVMIAIQADALVDQQRLEVWALDTDSNSSDIKPNRIAAETFFLGGLHALRRIPGNKAEGDFLLASGTYPLEGITLQGWRSAPRN